MGDPSGQGRAALTVSPALLRAGAWRGVALGVLAVVIGTTAGLLRQPGAGALDTIWAEDGGIFLGEAVREGPLSALTASYAGYYHLVPRLLAMIATAFPAGAASEVLAIEAAAVVALLALLVYVASGEHLPSRWSRLLVSAPIVAVPVAQGDVLNSIANLHWYGLYALFWMLIWTPTGRAGRVIATAVVFLVAASDILVVVFIPLALWRAMRRPSGNRHGVLLGLALATGLVVQFAGLLTGSSERELTPDPVRAVTGYLLRAVPAPLVGERWLGDEITARWVLLAAVAWLIVGAIVLLAWLRTRRPGLVPAAAAVQPAWPLAIGAALHSAGLYMLPVLLSGTATPRYAVAPGLLVVTALVALLQPDQASGRGKAPLYALTGLLALVMVVNFRVDNSRADGPTWSDELDRARTACASSDTAPAIPITPRDETPPWQVRAPCSYIR
ncbi:hypothetical protein [Phytohabitans aurantiacus]|uniref:hypothetical protein n=1 Tax=Phytohabitans aurantiacus TaxID=3016789 RepID=UPI00249020CD|nr:hypothetical protein [Phytohabitans aurantiacus]